MTTERLLLIKERITLALKHAENTLEQYRDVPGWYNKFETNVLNLKQHLYEVNLMLDQQAP